MAYIDLCVVQLKKGGRTFWTACWFVGGAGVRISTVTAMCPQPCEEAGDPSARFAGAFTIIIHVHSAM